MKYLLVFIMLVSAGAILAQADSLSQVNNEIELERLIKLDQKGIQNPDLYNNIGVYYYHVGRFGFAARYFLKALNLDSAHSDALNNLDHIIDISKDKALYPEQTYLVKLFFRVYNYLNINRMAVLTLILFAVFILTIHWLLHFDPSREKGLPMLFVIISTLLLIAMCATLITKYQRMINNRKAVVIVTETDAYDGGGTQYNMLFSIHEALIVNILKEENGWSLVSLPNGSSAWVKSTDILPVIER